MKRLGVLLASFIALGAPASAKAEEGVEILQYYAERVAHVQLVGELFNGEQEAPATGSGFLIGDRLILTNNHVVPDVAGNYRTLIINVRLRSRNNAPIRGTVVARDPAIDLALVELETAAAPIPFCPVAPLTGAAQLPPGSRLYVVGFPLDADLSIVDGLLSNHTSPERWQTAALINVGNSGGPVFSRAGYMVGIALGGVVSWSFGGGPPVNVTGVNYFIPTTRLGTSPVGDAIAQRVDSQCWRAATSLAEARRPIWPEQGDALAATLLPGEHMAAVSSPGLVGMFSAIVSPLLPVLPSVAPPATNIGAGAAVPPLPTTFSRSFVVSETKDDHPVLVRPHSRPYRRHFQAESGYRITACAFSALSANHTQNIACSVAPDGRSAVLTFRLESGPAFDRWRGWLHGQVNLAQILVSAEPAPRR